MPNIQVQLSKEHQAALEALEELQTRFYKKLDGYQIPNGGTTTRVRVALAMTAACIEYGESVRILCKAGNSMPAQALLRPLQEGWINLAYYLSDKDDTRIRVATADDIRQIRATARLLKEYLQENKREKLSRFSLKKLEKIIEAKTKDLDEAERQFHESRSTE